MVDEMINTVRAALAQGADAATKQQAAAILRGLLGMLEPGTEAPSVPTLGVLDATSAPGARGANDLLTAIVERVRPFLPAEELEGMPRFRVPLIDFADGVRRK